MDSCTKVTRQHAQSSFAPVLKYNNNSLLWEQHYSSSCCFGSNITRAVAALGATLLEQ